MKGAMKRAESFLQGDLRWRSRVENQSRFPAWKAGASLRQRFTCAVNLRTTRLMFVCAPSQTRSAPLVRSLQISFKDFFLHKETEEGINTWQTDGD